MNEGGNRTLPATTPKVCIDGKHKLIVHHEVTDAGHDQNLLSDQRRAAMLIISVTEITVVADGGYYSEAELAACQEEANATIYVPLPDKHKAVASHGRLSVKRFQYNRTRDVYICPASELLPRVVSRTQERRPPPVHPL